MKWWLLSHFVSENSYSSCYGPAWFRVEFGYIPQPREWGGDLGWIRFRGRRWTFSI
jgi:hypothetical protein